MRTQKALLAILMAVGMVAATGCSGVDDVFTSDSGSGGGGVQSPASPTPPSSVQQDGGAVDLR
jgi:hypothetical protein